MSRSERQDRGPAAAHIEAEVPPEWNALTERIIGCAIEVHRILGPGLLEKLYETALQHELTQAGCRVERQRAIRVQYKGIELGDQFMDFVIDNTVVLELKAVENIADVHLAQLVSYMRTARLPLGLLLNFNVPLMRDGIYRRINAQACPKRPALVRP